MKDLFKETGKVQGKIIGCIYCGSKEEKVALHRRVRHFLKRLLKKEIKEIDNASDSKR